MYGYEIFHTSIMEKLIQSVRSNTFSHAYIFSGEKGIGKLNAARLFANALVCTGSSAPCGECDSCSTAKALTNPDIIYIDTGDKKSIGVETIRDINNDVFVKPFSSKAKVYIIKDGSLMTEAAQNALLKTLEEPPMYAVFIILCNDISAMLQTVISRCSVISFGRVERSRLESYAAQKYGVENPDFIVNISEGNPGIIDEYLSGGEFKTLRENSVKMLRPLLSSNLLSIYVVSDFLEENKQNIPDILNFWIVLIRDILLLSHSSHIINSDIIKFLRNSEASYSENYLINAVNILSIAHEMYDKFVNVRAISLYITTKIKNYST